MSTPVGRPTADVEVFSVFCFIVFLRHIEPTHSTDCASLSGSFGLPLCSLSLCMHYTFAPCFGRMNLPRGGGWHVGTAHAEIKVHPPPSPPSPPPCSESRATKVSYAWGVSRLKSSFTLFACILPGILYVVLIYDHPVHSTLFPSILFKYCVLWAMNCE